MRDLLMATALCLPTAALAEMPVFSALCMSNHFNAEGTGTVRINAAVMDVEAQPGEAPLPTVSQFRDLNA